MVGRLVMNIVIKKHNADNPKNKKGGSSRLKAICIDESNTFAEDDDFRKIVVNRAIITIS